MCQRLGDERGFTGTLAGRAAPLLFGDCFGMAGATDNSLTTVLITVPPSDLFPGLSSWGSQGDWPVSTIVATLSRLSHPASSLALVEMILAKVATILHDTDNKDLAISGQLPQALLQILACYQNEAGSCALVVRSLSSIAVWSSARRRAVYSLGALAAVVSVLRDHVNSEEATFRVSEFLVLTALDKETQRQISSTALPLILQALQTHKASQRVVQNFCQALFYMTHSDLEQTKRVVDCGFVPILESLGNGYKGFPAELLHGISPKSGFFYFFLGVSGRCKALVRHLHPNSLYP
jgi:hypothetical protein